MSDTPQIGFVERLVRNDRVIVIIAVITIVALAGIYTITGVGMNMSAFDMTAMSKPIGAPMQMGKGANWTATYATLIALMWWVMMIAMMTPSAAPTLLLFTALKHHRKDKQNAVYYSGLLLAGYLIIWAVFSIIATSLQWGLETLDLISAAMMTVSSRLLAGFILLSAGLYQFSELKSACLKHCRSPAYFLSKNNRSGAFGALMMGMHHGVYCLGCCWALMALLFVGGIMNLYWIVGLALYVLAEKTVPFGGLFSRATGVILIFTGTYVTFSSLS